MILAESEPKGWRTYNGRKCPIQDVLEHTSENIWTVYRDVCNGIARSIERYRTREEALRAFRRSRRR